jgi:predicted negative regulator of RcsB-dependent stress response
MATYDLEQQEQIDQFKHFWQTYGNLITWTLVLAVGAYASWMGYTWWQNDRGAKSAVLYEELDRAVIRGEGDKVNRVFSDLKDNYGGATYTEHGALLAAQFQAAKGKSDEARASLQWLIEHGKNPDLVIIARLRQAGILLDQKKYDEALKQLDVDIPEAYKALASDRKGDILYAQGKKPEALKLYQAAYDAMDPAIDYRRFIEGKLTALGAPPAVSSLTSPAAAAAAN